MRIEIGVDFLTLEDGKVVGYTDLEASQGGTETIYGDPADTEDEAFENVKAKLFPVAPDDLSELL
jgi:hypothetical protein